MTQEELHEARTNPEFLGYLTKREEEVMGVICSGINAKAGADKLHISIYTFETHKKNIFRKFDINSTNELMRIAMDFNLV